MGAEKIRPIANDVYDMMCENPNLKLSRKDPSKTRVNTYRLLRKFDIAEVKCYIRPFRLTGRQMEKSGSLGRNDNNNNIPKIGKYTL